MTPARLSKLLDVLLERRLAPKFIAITGSNEVSFDLVPLPRKPAEDLALTDRPNQGTQA